MLHRLWPAALAVPVLLAAAVPSSARAQMPPPAAPLTSALPVAAPAIPDDPYTVSGVEVDITAASAAEARDKAILEGQRKAFATLFKRIVPDAATRVAPSVSDADLQRMVQGFEIEREKGSAVRYVGSLSFKFRRKAVRGHLGNLGISVVEPAPQPALGAPGAPAMAPAAAQPVPGAPPAGLKPTLVLPVSQGRAGYLLWEERTPWRTAWEDFSAAAGAAKVVIPPGELADIADIGAREAVAGDAAALAKIAAHYDAGDVVVALLPGGERLDPAAGAQVQLSRYGADGRPEGSADAVPVSGAAGEAPPAFLGRAVSAVVDRLSTLPSAPAPTGVAPPPPAGAESQIQVGVPITGMQDWLEIRRRLTANPMVAGVETVSLTRSRVDITIRFRGEQEGLRAMLDRDSLTLAPAPTGWSLYLKSSAQSAAPRPAPASAPASLAPMPQPPVNTGAYPAPQPIPAPAPAPGGGYPGGAYPGGGYPGAGAGYYAPSSQAPAPYQGAPGYGAPPPAPSEYDPDPAGPAGEDPAYDPRNAYDPRSATGPGAGGGYPGYPGR